MKKLISTWRVCFDDYWSFIHFTNRPTAQPAPNIKVTGASAGAAGPATMAAAPATAPATDVVPDANLSTVSGEIF